MVICYNLFQDPKESIMLRDVTSFFLLAYFFPGSDKEDSQPSEVSMLFFTKAMIYCFVDIRAIFTLQAVG